MKISEVEELLKKIKEKEGDIEVTILNMDVNVHEDLEIVEVQNLSTFQGWGTPRKIHKQKVVALLSL